MVQCQISGSRQVFPILLSAKREIDSDLQYPMANDVRHEISKYIAPFNVIREMVVRDPENFEENVADRDKFNEQARKTLEELYKENRVASCGPQPEALSTFF